MSINKVVIYLILPILAFVLTSCDNDKDVRAIDLKLIDGVWEVVDEGNQDVFFRGCFLNLSTSQDQSNGTHGSICGIITTFYLTATGRPLHDKVYSWSIRNMENDLPLLDLVLQGELDSDDQWEGNYTVTKLTDTHMWWQGRSNEDHSTIKFRRCTDIKQIITNRQKQVE